MGYELEDVHNHREEEFVPKWLELHNRFCKFYFSTGTWLEISTDERNTTVPIILITHDKSTFNANDSRRRSWRKDKEHPIFPKDQGKKIMVSVFLAMAGILKIPSLSRTAKYRKSTWIGSSVP